MSAYKVSKSNTLWYLRSLGYDTEPGRTGIDVYIETVRTRSKVEKMLREQAIERVRKLAKDFGYAGRIFICPKET